MRIAYITSDAFGAARKKPQAQSTYRVCCVCGKRHGSTSGFKIILARAGFRDWGHGFDKAVPSCVQKFLKQADKNQRPER